METKVDDILDASVTLHRALAPMTITALSYARMSNWDKAKGDQSGYWERQFVCTVDCIAHLLDAAMEQRGDFDVFSDRRRQLENFLGDEADDPDVWHNTDHIQRNLIEMWGRNR